MQLMGKSYGVPSGYTTVNILRNNFELEHFDLYLKITLGVK